MSTDEFSTKIKRKLVQVSHLDEFQYEMRRRLDEGRKKYTDKSFLTDNLFTDIKEEILDVANYAYLLFERIRRLEEGEKATDYLNFCNAVDITNESESDRGALEHIFKKYKVCHRIGGREYHYCQKEDDSE